MKLNLQVSILACFYFFLKSKKAFIPEQTTTHKRTVTTQYVSFTESSIFLSKKKSTIFIYFFSNFLTSIGKYLYRLNILQNQSHSLYRI